MYFSGNLKQLYVADICKLLAILPNDLDESWFLDKSRQQKNYLQHGDTLNIRAVINDSPWVNFNSSKAVKYNSELVYEINILAEQLAKFLNGVVIQAVLIMLPPNKKVLLHVDVHPLDKVHRCHIPIVVNDFCTLTVDGIDYKPQVGVVYELNNQKPHKAENNGNTSRIHLLIDILPNENI